MLMAQLLSICSWNLALHGWNTSFNCHGRNQSLQYSTPVILYLRLFEYWYQHLLNGFVTMMLLCGGSNSKLWSSYVVVFVTAIHSLWCCWDLCLGRWLWRAIVRQPQGNAENGRGCHACKTTTVAQKRNKNSLHTNCSCARAGAAYCMLLTYESFALGVWGPGFV